jgi:hypothetical protein
MSIIFSTRREDKFWKIMLFVHFLLAVSPLAGITRLQRVRRWAAQAPGQARGSIIKVHRTIYAVLGHCFHNHGAEPAPLRPGNEWPVGLNPARGEGVALGRQQTLTRL